MFYLDTRNGMARVGDTLLTVAELLDFCPTAALAGGMVRRDYNPEARFHVLTLADGTQQMAPVPYELGDYLIRTADTIRATLNKSRAARGVEVDWTIRRD